MGTRSTTKIYDNGKLVLALYKQYDGYPSDWGEELKTFIQSGVFVNGISDSKLPRNKTHIFNGIGDFALQLVTRFKHKAGDLYATTEDDTEEYNYKIEFNHNFETRKAKKILSSEEEDADDEKFFYEEDIIIK